MARQKNSKLVQIIMGVVLLLLLVGGIGAIVHFTGISKDDITDIVNPVFRVELDGKVYKAGTENNIISLPLDSKVRFEVKGVKSYTVSVAPNVTADTDFTYSVDGQTYSYGSENLTFAFDLSCYDNAFVVVLDDNLSLEYVLAKLWGKGIDAITVGEHGDFPLYKFVITSSNGEVIELLFGSRVLGLTVPETILF